MTLPQLAVVVPTFNRIDRLRACLIALSAHAPPDADLLVVDDASPANVADVVAAFPKVRHIRLRSRGGFCVAANAGIAATRAPIVELLNDDAEVTAGWAEAALQLFTDPEVAAVAPLVLRPDGRIDSAGDDYDRGGFARKIGHGLVLSPEYLVRRPVVAASGSSAFYRRSFLDRVGTIAESFGAYFEDVDLSLRLRRAGGVILFEPASRVLHWGGSSHGPPSRRLIEQQSRNEELLYWRNSPGNLPRHLAVLAGKALRRWSEGRLMPWTFGRLRAWLDSSFRARHPVVTKPSQNRIDAVGRSSLS